MSPPTEKPPSSNPDPSLGDLPLAVYASSVSRDKFLAIYRRYLSLFKRSLTSLRSQSTEGQTFVQEYSHMVDAVVGVLFQRAVEEHGLTPDGAEVAIIGMGGYGREELAPYSDVDILVLCKRKTPLVNHVVASFIRFMWDVGFELGHSVESIIESEKSLAGHMDTRTALFESRCICGSRKIAREAERQIKRLRRKDREAFLKRKIRDATARHKKYSNSYQLIEPNVKLSPGGLRDFQTLVWLGLVLPGGTGLSALRKKGLLLPGEAKALEAAYDFLLRVRVELHLSTESKQDDLTIRMQKMITEQLGYRGHGDHLGVEIFMRDYYSHTRTICRITNDVIEELDFGKNVGALLGRKKVPKKAGRLSVRLDRAKMSKDPLYVFAKQKEKGLRLPRATSRRLERTLEEELKGRSARRNMRQSFPQLLTDGKNTTLVLRSMHETGFLGAIIPEYNELTSLKRYDLYHHYTVDEHCFQVVENLEQLATARSRHDSLSRLYSEMADKQILFLAALLHDVGKIAGRGHAKKGAVLARKIMKRLSLDQAKIDVVSHLIEIHLLMSHFSQRRDPSDIGTLQTFCGRVGSRTNLKYLCLLTYADLKATSPVVWSEWKRSLLWALYVGSYQFISKKEKEPDKVYKQRKATLLRAFPKGPARVKALDHLDMLPGRYLLIMNASQVRHHMALIETIGARRAVVSVKPGKAATEVTFCTLDKPYRLSQLCGVLTMNDCNILFAHAFTRTDGTVLDVFQVESIDGVARVDEARAEQIESDLHNVLTGRTNIQAEVDKHLAKWKRRKDAAIPMSPKVEFDNDVSVDVTIIDIFAMDKPGLLYMITRALSEEGLTIHRARISTEANRVIDSFDVHDRKGNKITSAAELTSIRRRLEAALG